MTTPLQISFGLRCRALRADTGLSQEQFAHRIGIDRSFYASIEVGQRNVTLATEQKIAKGLGITLSELMEDVGP